MAKNYTAVLPLLKTKWAEVKNQFVVIRKCSKSQVNDVCEFIYSLYVCVFLARMKKWRKKMYIKVVLLFFFHYYNIFIASPFFADLMY